MFVDPQMIIRIENIYVIQYIIIHMKIFTKLTEAFPNMYFMLILYVVQVVHK